MVGVSVRVRVRVRFRAMVGVSVRVRFRVRVGVRVRVKVRLGELDRRVCDDVKGRGGLPRAREEPVRREGEDARRAARLERGGAIV
eukprot:scaffold4820_cov67-Phaeocystis_antarctica.AAC.8